MAQKSPIEWTDITWNPVAGCSLASAGCTNCYAMRMAARLDAMGVKKYEGLTRKSAGRSVWTGRIALDDKTLEQPFSWVRPKIVFVNSMADLFHESVPEEFIGRVWQVMRDTPRHTYQVLTKRPERMARLLNQRNFEVLTNVWLGTSVEDNRVVYRIDELREVPAKIRFISFEPLIGSVEGANLKGIQWAIVGGESGPGSRPMRSEWIDEIEVMCRDADAAFFFKQWGGRNKKATGRTLRGRTYDEMPSLLAA